MKTRFILGFLALILSSSLSASEVSNLIAISSDESETTYLLADVQRINVYANDTDGGLSIVSKEGTEVGGYKKIIFASVTTSIGEENVPNVYVYPSPVENTLYVSGVDEDDTHLVVYDLNGNCLLGRQGNEIDVTPLHKGTYILCIDDHFVKFIKN